MSEFITDGSLSFAGGVNSLKPTTVASERHPDGLGRNQLAWLNNATVRGGGITCRTGWQFLASLGHNQLYQGGFIYKPDGADPYLVLSLSGRLWRVRVDTNNSIDQLTTDALRNPEAEERSFFVQGEQFMIVQAGDNVTLPLIWDGATLRRSVGLTSRTFMGNTTNTLWRVPAIDGTSTVALNLDQNYAGAVGNVIEVEFVGTFEVTAIAGNVITIKTISSQKVGFLIGYTTQIFFTPTAELPAATAMDYYMGRIWYARGRTYTAGDIVKGPSGTLAYNFRDSILKITENPLAFGGDGFTVPGEAGDIRAIDHTAELDTALGQGQLYIFTRSSIYRLAVPVTRQQWIDTADSTQPLQTVAQLRYGSVSDRCLVHVNGDIFYQTMEPGIRSLALAIRHFGQWGNTPISNNEERILRFNDRSLMRFASGIEYNNRLLMTALPTQTPVGVAFQALIPLDFDLISTLEEKRPPAWEGMQEGLDILEVLEGDFGGRQRAFAVVHSRASSAIQVWEITDHLKGDFNQTGEARINWVVETPAYTWGQEFLLKELMGGELWIDRLHGEVLITVEYRPDGDPCWHFWNQWTVCSARNTCEDVNNPVCYPITDYPEGYKQTMALPRPQTECAPAMARPVSIGYQFQAKITVMGWCRIRGFIMYAKPVEKALYYSMVCPGDVQKTPTTTPMIPPGGGTGEVTDPILGPPYPPVGFQMNNPQQIGNQILLTWTIPGLIIQVTLETPVPGFTVIMISNYDGGNTLAEQNGNLVTLTGPEDFRFVSTAQEVGTQVRWSNLSPNNHETATIVQVTSPTTAIVAENQVVAAGKFTYWNPNTTFKLYVRNPTTLEFEVKSSVPPETTQNGYLFQIESHLFVFADVVMGPNWAYQNDPGLPMLDAYITASVSSGFEVFSPIFQIYQQI